MTLLFLGALTAAAAPFDDRVAKMEKVERCTLDIDGDGDEERVAVRLGLAVVELEDRLALLTGNHFECAEELVHETMATPSRTAQQLQLEAEGFVVRAQHRDEAHHCVDSRTEIDWGERRVSHRRTPCADPEVRYEGAVIPLSGPDADKAVPLAFTAFAAGDPKQRAKGEVVVSWEGGTPVVTVKVDDDIDVRLPADPQKSDWVLADHVELWCEDGAGDIHMLGVARSSEGPLVAAWLQGDHFDAAGARPRMEEGFRFRLPRQCAPRGGWEARPFQSIRFSVAYSDADGPDGQHTLVATSTLQWREPESFGVLARWSGAGGLPPWDGGLEWSQD